jgi:hypothetical protein
MSFSSWLRNLRSPWARTSLQTRRQTSRRRSPRLTVEQLEDRLVPSNFTAANVTQLIADINAANKAGGTNTITLTAPTSSPYILAATNNTTDGATGLPVLAAKDNLTILGNGDTIERSTASGTPAFRLLDVASGASLTLQNMTLQNGLAFGSGSAAEGGAIYNQGTLDLNGVTVQNNIAQGQNGTSGFHAGTPGQSAAGGGIYSSGSLTLEGGTSVQNNQALGGQGGTDVTWYGNYGWAGGNGFGGGVFVADGTATLTDVTVSYNNAKGGVGGNWRSIHGGHPGLGEGGGLYINTLATVYLDAFTVANVLNNTASTSDPNIHGSYNLLP